MNFLKILGAFLILSYSSNAQNKSEKIFQTPFERDTTHTSTYEEAVSFYKSLTEAYKNNVRFETIGNSDEGIKIYQFIISEKGINDGDEAHKKNKMVLFINNGIHAGEPEGVDASMLFAREILQSNNLNDILKNSVIVIIPQYNVEGALNRNSTTRVNQNGPAEYGFRGTRRNFDLNRDFIKSDAENTVAFQKAFFNWQPDIFIDTHTSNGADYQYTLTLLETNINKLTPPAADFQKNKLLPYLYKKMEAQNQIITPYVDFADIPDNGLYGFFDSPRYSTGFTTLHNTIGFMIETHMLKPFAQRVRVTHTFLNTLLKFCTENAEAIIKVHTDAENFNVHQKEFPLRWHLDTSQFTMRTFNGYAAEYKKSEATTGSRLYYDRSKPYSKQVKYFNYFVPDITVQRPYAYVINASQKKIITTLQRFNVKMQSFVKPTNQVVEVYKILEFTSTEKPYEGHHPNKIKKIEKNDKTITLSENDYIIVLDENPRLVRFLIETLEPQATDSYFTWNYFDAILEHKEGFSDYVFEDIATDLLNSNTILNALLKNKLATDSTFKANSKAQLTYIYNVSKYAEPNFSIYPIYRIKIKELRN